MRKTGIMRTSSRRTYPSANITVFQKCACNRADNVVSVVRRLPSTLVLIQTFDTALTDINSDAYQALAARIVQVDTAAPRYLHTL